MSDTRFVRDKRGRRKAASLYVCLIFVAAVLSGCTSLRSNDRPLIATLAAFLPFGSESSDRAGEIPYGSIYLTLGGRGGLLILAREQPGVTYWQSSSAEVVVLNRGYLSSTAGLPHNLQMTEFDGLAPAATLATPFAGDRGQPLHYRVTRRWQVGDEERTVARTADATLSCESGTVSVSLPLATLPLQKCREVLKWRGGGTTRSDYWIDPKTDRIWKARTRAWPGAPTITWEVARPWW